MLASKIIRIHHECEDGIEKSVPRSITVWYQEACRVMTNRDPPRDGFFYPILTQIMDFFFLLTIDFLF